ncbi:maleylpyruvate isomerase family mycothiol-dependent enzyme [Kitasatospora nipponensis]|uniref:Maleylpyruvate isomerase family mycothiol-dependent enzyme n=1 Tax=Kitasatospora nipponensis TaxID=258049 RepID=A0ABN1WCZ1_9ACTN
MSEPSAVPPDLPPAAQPVAPAAAPPAGLFAGSSATQARLLAVNVAAAEDIAAVLRGAPDPNAPVPGSTWSIGEAAAHLALANGLMADLARGLERGYGDGSPDSLAAANEDSLAAYPERDPAVLADAIVEHARAFAEHSAARPGTEAVLTPLGPMDQATLASYLLTHQLGHGYDLARALRRPHMIDRERVELSLPFLLTAMPRVAVPEASAGRRIRYAVGLRGGELFEVTVDDGTVTVVPRPPSRPDCVIVTEPVTFFLLALGRRTRWQAMARGGIRAGGRRPWLALGFPGYFRAP